VLSKDEQWKPVPNYDGYEVSSHGRVRSSKRGSWRILKPGTNRDGYRYVILFLGGTGKHAHICRLVAMAWHGEPKPGQVVRHLDGSRDNDVPENLQWGTLKENSHDRIAHGTIINGANVHSAKLTEKQVKEILSSNLPRGVLAKRYGVSGKTITRIRTGRSWKHVRI
jgi:hypothetical protein